jgi:CheY-like chemotaxis protein
MEIGLFNVEIKDGDNLHLRGLKPGSYIELTVSDTGDGIEPAIRKQIFDPFFTTKKVGKGTGLGLSVVHGIVKNHGGEITVESRVGEGTVFRVYFPLIDEKYVKKFEDTHLVLTGNMEHILFVDDEEALVEMAKDMLQGLSYVVTAKTNSVEALDTFRAHPERFNLVITDQTMPEMDGVALAREIMLIRPDMPVILCTGFSHVTYAEEVKAAGIREIAVKPIVRHQIAGTIRRALKID